jgi:DNA-binding beta-propeller fold protein YncE
MNMKRITNRLVLVSVVVCAALVSAQDNRVPKYSLDTSWPKLPFKNRWVLGDIGGICLDSQDHVFALNRGTTDDADLDAGLDAPPVIEFDPDGNIVNGWGDRPMLGMSNALHGCHVDKDQNLWIVSTSGKVLKYTRDGKLLLQLEGLTSAAAIAIDPQNGDIYIADAKDRIQVMDRAGKANRDFRLNRAAGETQPQILHCVVLSNDGFVYVCDRHAFRVQVFDRMGKFIQNIDVPWKPYTPPEGRKTSGGSGSASAVAFSRDTNQRYLFATNEDNSQIEILDRKSGQHLGSFGFGAGHFPGQFTHVHGIVVDSRNDIYTTEVLTGKRVQKWRLQ